MAAENALEHPQPLAAQHWPAGTVPLVSVLCITYNHEDFIEECLDGLLMQETSFPVEIIVHDDASTDGTRSIVQRYHDEYAWLFKPVFQQQNQYSRREKPALLAVRHASGRYVALCEGDDCWIHPGKLERQIKALMDNADSDLCFHPALIESYGSDICGDEEVIGSHGGGRRVIGVEEVIAGDGSFCPTASLVIRREVYGNLPAWYRDAPVGDYYVQIIAASKGGAVYLPEPMSIYRKGIAGSWSENIKSSEKKVVFLLSTIRSLHEADLWLNESCHREFSRQITKYLHMLSAELGCRLDLSSQSIHQRPAARGLTPREKWARFRRQVRSLGFGRAVLFTVGHRLFLLGNRMKRMSNVDVRSIAQT
jgi:glycosyltransferase involved in cell wall biosynthesis